MEVIYFYLLLFWGRTYGMQDVSSPTRDRTHAPCTGITESQPLDHQGSPMTWSHLHTKMLILGTSLVVQRLRLCAPSAGGLGSIPGQGSRSHTLWLKIPHAATKIQFDQIKICFLKNAHYRNHKNDKKS